MPTSLPSLWPRLCRAEYRRLLQPVPSERPTAAPTAMPTERRRMGQVHAACLRFAYTKPTLQPTGTPTVDQRRSLPGRRRTTKCIAKCRAYNFAYTRTNVAAHWNTNGLPTALPTLIPSNHPTPTFSSAVPSTVPTTQPTGLPSSIPTAAPSLQPSGVPTHFPTIYPSRRQPS